MSEFYESSIENAKLNAGLGGDKDSFDVEQWFKNFRSLVASADLIRHVEKNNDSEQDWVRVLKELQVLTGFSYATIQVIGQKFAPSTPYVLYVVKIKKYAISVPLKVGGRIREFVPRTKPYYFRRMLANYGYQQLTQEVSTLDKYEAFVVAAVAGKILRRRNFKARDGEIPFWLCVPLVFRQKLVGFIFLEQRDEIAKGFKEYATDEVLMRVAYILASAIDTSFEKWRAAVLRDIASRISAKNSTVDILTYVADYVYRELDDLNKDKSILRCTFFKRDDFRNGEPLTKSILLSWVDNDGIIDENSLRWTSFEESIGVAGAVLHDLKPRISYKLSTVSLRDEEPSQTNTVSMIAAPVVISFEDPKKKRNIRGELKKRCIAVITVDSKRAGAFCQYDLDFIEAVAQQTALVVERTWLIERAHEIGQELSKYTHKITMRDYFKIIYEGVQEVINATCGGLFFVRGNEPITLKEDAWYTGNLHFKMTQKAQDDIREKIKNLAKEYLSIDNAQPKRKRILQQHPLTQEQTPHFLGQYKSESQDQKAKDQQDINVIKCAYAILIRLEEAVVGVLYVSSTTKEQLNEIEVSALNIFADYAAIAIQKVENQRKLQALETATEIISQSRSLQQALDRIAAQACELVDAETCYLALLHSESERIQFEAVHPPKYREPLTKLQELFNFKVQGDMEGITSLAIKRCMPSYLRDVAEDVKLAFYQNLYIPGPNNPPIEDAEDSLVDDEGLKGIWKKINAKARQHKIDVGEIWVGNTDSATASELVVPIKKTHPSKLDFALGALNIVSNRKTAFTSADIDMMERFADIVGRIIESFRNPHNAAIEIIDRVSCDVFVSLHLSEQSKTIERVVKEAIKSINPHWKNITVGTVSQVIDREIWTRIVRCRVFIADITNWSIKGESDQIARPNVMYELGIAMGLNKPIVLIAKKGSPLPSDIANYVVEEYEQADVSEANVSDAVQNSSNSFAEKLARRIHTIVSEYGEHTIHPDTKRKNSADTAL
jgi:GAF domain-containing protein